MFFITYVPRYLGKLFKLVFPLGHPTLASFDLPYRSNMIMYINIWLYPLLISVHATLAVPPLTKVQPYLYFIYCCMDCGPRTTFTKAAVALHSNGVEVSHSLHRSCFTLNPIRSSKVSPNWHNQQTSVAFLTIENCFFGLPLHLAHMTLFSFDWPMQEYFTSNQLI